MCIRDSGSSSGFNNTATSAASPISAGIRSSNSGGGNNNNSGSGMGKSSSSFLPMLLGSSQRQHRQEEEAAAALSARAPQQERIKKRLGASLRGPRLPADVREQEDELEAASCVEIAMLDLISQVELRRVSLFNRDGRPGFALSNHVSPPQWWPPEMSSSFRQQRRSTTKQQHQQQQRPSSRGGGGGKNGGGGNNNKSSRASQLHIGDQQQQQHSITTTTGGGQSSSSPHTTAINIPTTTTTMTTISPSQGGVGGTSISADITTSNSNNHNNSGTSISSNPNNNNNNSINDENVGGVAGDGVAYDDRSSSHGTADGSIADLVDIRTDDSSIDDTPQWRRQHHTSVIEAGSASPGGGELTHVASAESMGGADGAPTTNTNNGALRSPFSPSLRQRGGGSGSYDATAGGGAPFSSSPRREDIYDQHTATTAARYYFLNPRIPIEVYEPQELILKLGDESSLHHFLPPVDEGGLSVRAGMVLVGVMTTVFLVWTFVTLVIVLIHRG
eukprot:TRINITY_DN4730_c0_g1_i1.p1 TRINITY_DN4730_c0_g1~~TRINITY_DN4730_c0_g1_i1.p1  ORF type:complete len:503 (-),score=117.76 TRINITY_DN4730_c0_g1_i1:320-1828(-)